ncbi:CopG family transcriptional regulator [Longibacter salinarum]|uniref:CopG family transcriptional regulator n=1 Tax=Longibacter salinarum TaxID=1850348 RepID=A0A2A8CX83_9BACT|nr:DUF411 domain-containing protein [Longibacter salinarum]PEN13359.1 CopG family transcriptional regulator [Longibacter salinarum]
MSTFYSSSTYLKVFAAGILIAAAGILIYTFMQPDAASQAGPASARNFEGIAESAPTMTVYSSPTCGCCSKWVDHLRENGFSVEKVNITDLGRKKSELGVPRNLSSCHTGVIGDYVIEGHVPAQQVKRLLAMDADVHGLTVPGMPIGSPGMEQGDRKEPYDVLAFNPDGSTGLFAEYHK